MLPVGVILFVDLFWFYLAYILGYHLWVVMIQIKSASGIFPFNLLSNFVTWINGAYFDRFVPFVENECLTLFWTLIFRLFDTFTGHGLIRAILS